MTNEEFKFWLSGYLNLTDEASLDFSQLTIIENHADLVNSVTGSLDQNIADLILTLRNLIDKNSALPMETVRRFATSLNCYILS